MTAPRLRHNIAALGTIQISTYVIPLLTIPYLTRTLGLEAWGKIAFALVILQYFALLVDFGFSWSAVSQIAAERDDEESISKTFVSTWVAQWLLLVLAIVLLSVVVFAFPMLKKDWTLYMAGLPLLFSQVLFPVWLLQGLEKLKAVAVIQLLARVLSIIPIFVFVKSPQDMNLTMAIQASTGIVSGVLCLYWINRSHMIQWVRPAAGDILITLQDAAGLFLSRSWISLYTNLIPLILGAVAGTSSVGIYRLADRIRAAAQSLLQPLSQAIFPRMSYLYSKGHEDAGALLQRTLVIVVCSGAAATVMLLLFSDWIIALFGGHAFTESASVLRWMALLPLVVGISNIFGIHVMIPNHRIKAFNLILAVGGIWALMLIYPLSYSHGAIGAALVTLSTELIVTLLMMIYLFKERFILHQHHPTPMAGSRGSGIDKRKP